MSRYIAFLRAINVGGHTVKMDALARLFAGMGFTAVETFIASGNVIFEATDKPAGLETKIERGLQQALGYEVATFVRTPADVARIATHPAFPAERIAAAGAYNVAFLKHPLDDEAQRKVQALETAIDAFHTHGRELYWLCNTKQSESKFSNAVFERALKTQATFRGINTVQKLAAKYAT